MSDIWCNKCHRKIPPMYLCECQMTGTQATIAILREALERIVDEEPVTVATNHYAYLEHGRVCGYRVENGENCTCGYDRLFAAFALAREALLSAGMGEEK